MDSWSHDVRVAVRQLLRRPAFAAVAVLTLAIGMGVNAVAFTVVNSVFVRGFASAAVPGLARIATTPGGVEEGYASLAELERFSAATRGSATLAAEGRMTMAWRHEGGTETAWVLAVSREYFSMSTPDVVAGRIRVERTTGANPPVVIGERFWREKLAARSLAGLTLRLNNVDVDVAGIVSESYTGPAGLYSPDVWVPLGDLALFHTSPALQKHDSRSCGV